MNPFSVEWPSDICTALCVCISRIYSENHLATDMLRHIMDKLQDTPTLFPSVAQEAIENITKVSYSI